MSSCTDIGSGKTLGKVVISYQSDEESNPLVLSIPEVTNYKFIAIAQKIAGEVTNDEEDTISVITGNGILNDKTSDLYASIITSGTDESVITLTEADEADDQEETMSDFNRSELQAHLKANKAEVDTVAASMKKDMAEWSGQIRHDLRDVKDAISSQQSELEKHFHSQQVKLDTSLELQSSKFDLALTNAKLEIIKWCLGIPALAFTVYKIYELATHTPTT